MSTQIPTSILKKICEFFGHRWRYLDYTNHIKPNGDDYDFKASRYCSRCKQYSYFYSDWEDAEKSHMDYVDEKHATKELELRQLQRSNGSGLNGTTAEPHFSEAPLTGGVEREPQEQQQ